MPVDLLVALGAAVGFILKRNFLGWKRFSEIQASNILPEQQSRAKLLVTTIQECHLNSLVSVISLLLIIKRDQQKRFDEYGNCAWLHWVFFLSTFEQEVKF